MSQQTWRTSIGPDTAAAYGVADLHVVLFQPQDDKGGPRHCFSLAIPETPDPILAEAIRAAGAMKARVVFVCDTRGQADDIANRAGRMLPRHRRIAYERAAAGQWGARQ